MEKSRIFIKTMPILCLAAIWAIPSPSYSQTVKTLKVAPVKGSITATLKADPTAYKGPCPFMIGFRGKIAVKQAGEVKYTFIRSDGALAPVNTLVFHKPGSKNVSTTWRIGRTYSGWIAIKVISPYEVESNKANFRIFCEEQSDTQQGQKDSGQPQSPEAQKKLAAQGKTILKLRPDLTANIKCPGSATPGEELGDRIKVFIVNKGNAPANNFAVDLVLSTDEIVPVKFAAPSPNFSEDMLLKGGRENVASLASRSTLNLKLNGTNKIPDDTPPGTYYLAVVVDPGNSVGESKEDNNVALCRIRISSPLPDLVVSGFFHTGAPPGRPPEARLGVTVVNMESGPVPLGAGRLDVYVEGTLVDSIPLDSDKVEQTAYHDCHNPYDPGNPGKSRSVVGTDYIFPPSSTSQRYTVRAVVDPANEIPETNNGNNSFERVEVIPPH